MDNDPLRNLIDSQSLGGGGGRIASKLAAESIRSGLSKVLTVNKSCMVNALPALLDLVCSIHRMTEGYVFFL